MARARRVLPVPGGPIIKTPFGMRPPSFWNFCGSLRNSMISCNSSFASSTPATSLNVTRFCWLFKSFARDLPKLKALLPPDCICRSMKIQMPTMKRIGAQLRSTPQSMLLPPVSSLTFDPRFAGRIILGSTELHQLGSAKLVGQRHTIFLPVFVGGDDFLRLENSRLQFAALDFRFQSGLVNLRRALILRAREELVEQKCSDHDEHPENDLSSRRTQNIFPASDANDTPFRHLLSLPPNALEFSRTSSIVGASPLPLNTPSDRQLKMP